MFYFLWDLDWFSIWGRGWNTSISKQAKGCRNINKETLCCISRLFYCNLKKLYSISTVLKVKLSNFRYYCVITSQQVTNIFHLKCIQVITYYKNKFIVNVILWPVKADWVKNIVDASCIHDKSPLTACFCHLYMIFSMDVSTW